MELHFHRHPACESRVTVPVLASLNTQPTALGQVQHLSVEA